MNQVAQTYLPDRKHAPERLGRVLVLGLGKSGRAAAQYCLGLLGTRVSSVAVYGGPSTDDARAFGDACEEAGATVFFDSEDVQGSYDICIASPGIPQPGAFYQRAAACCSEVVSEVEFAWRESRRDARWVAITGTNGKTTTTALLSHLLQTCGYRAAAVGNIGDTCLQAVADDSIDIYVAEVSSYQLASTVHFAPDVAVMLNITPDHLAWHGSFEAYVDAKAKLFANVSERCACVLDATNETVRAFVRQMRAQGNVAYVPVGTADGQAGDMRVACGSANAAFVRSDGMLVVAYNGAEHSLVPTQDLQIVGEHNAGNALMAAAAALCLEAPVEGVRAGLASFAALEHRIEPCGSVRGVACYNDSKATNVDATLKALAAFAPKRPIALLGGDDKGTDLSDLVASAQKHCKAVVCFGAAGPRFAAAFQGSGVDLVRATTMERALDAALSVAQDGDIVLLSPACASFDEFNNFEQRGAVFKQLVADRQG